MTHPLFAALALSWQCVYPIAAMIAGRDHLVCSGNTAGNTAACKCVTDVQADAASWSLMKDNADMVKVASQCKQASAGSAVVPSFLLATAACLAVLIAPRRFQ